MEADKKVSHNEHLTNKFGYERNKFDYSSEGIFHWKHIQIKKQNHMQIGLHEHTVYT